eukprot:jgi/Galph1/3625/GphlegSOOS_G2294.1
MEQDSTFVSLEVDQDINFDILRLKRWLINEKCCNDIFPFQEELVGGLLELCQFQQKLVDEITESEDIAGVIIRNLKQLELERLYYLLKEYLRVRLRKIEKNIFYYWRDTNRWSYLSAAEQEYAKQLHQTLMKHFENSFLKFLPEKLRVVDERDGDNTPVTFDDMDEFVFIYAQKEIGAVSTDQSSQVASTIHIRKGEVVCLRYSIAKQFLQEESAVLL